MRESWIMSERKERTKEAVIERYLGKKAILDSWEECNLVSAPKSGTPEPIEREYLYNLRRRVRGYSMELTYRGVDEFVELTHA